MTAQATQRPWRFLAPWRLKPVPERQKPSCYGKTFAPSRFRVAQAVAVERADRKVHATELRACPRCWGLSLSSNLRNATAESHAGARRREGLIGDCLPISPSGRELTPGRQAAPRPECCGTLIGR